MSEPARSPARQRRSLHEGWSLTLTEPEEAPVDVVDLPAVVPGCVHTDLLRAGLIADADVGTAEDEQHWIGRSGWTYRMSFAWDGPEAEHIELVCDGLDTLAGVRLNGEHVGRTRNMHRGYRFDIGASLRPGDNTLEVRFASIYDEVARVRAAVGPLPAAYPTHYPYVRKMACNFGWDWGPKLTTAGIWRDLAIESWSTARLGTVRPLVDVDGTTGRVTCHLDVDGDGDGLRAVVRIGEHRSDAEVADGGAVVVLDVPDVERWWPVGLGGQPLYDVEVRLLAGDHVLDEQHRRIGFRTVEVAEEPDEVGRRWAFVVNGQHVPIRGYNWIPDDVFVTEVDRDRYARRLDQAVAGNANLLRVWGGGIYESDDFYELCDERGILVWQDFLFACAAYPETDDYAAEVEAEARDAIGRLVGHPSLVLWNGNNENVWGYHDWGWQQELEGRPWGGYYYGELLPALVAELDPTRPYLIGSPSSGSLEADPNDDAVGVQHLWDVWNQVDYPVYREHPASFVAEMGWCGPPTWATLRRAVPDGELLPANPVVQHHLRAADGVDKLTRGLAPRFPGDHAPDDWHLLAQIVQARSQIAGTEHLRALPRCSGVVIWQLNDCWPVISWAAVDGDERRKPLWYALRRAFAPRHATLQPDGDGLALVLIADTWDRWSSSAHVRRVAFDGTILAEAEFDVACDPFDVAWTRLSAELARPDDPSSELLIVDVGDVRASWFWAEDTELRYPRAAFDAGVSEVAGGLAVTITATTLLRELCIFPDRLLVDGEPVGPDVVVDDQLVTLLPGETHTFTVRGAGPQHVEALRGAPVVRCTNDVTSIGRA